MSRDYVLQPFRASVDLQIDYAKELNEQQHEAVTALPGPALVIAGAGSGKTRTLIYRVAYLLEQGIPPERILLLTFTNKAAKEMMRRVSDLLGNELLNLWGGTFHSIGNRILRRHAKLLGYQPDFTIMDREDAKDLIEACLGEMKIDVKATRFPKADVIADIFSLCINKERTIPEILKEQFDYFLGLGEQLQELQEHYVKRKQATNAVDFDDLLCLWLKLFKENPDICEDYQRRFQFLLVDEYQDTNKIQADIIDLLAAKHHNVMVVGDDSQSIYSWRGANFQNILKFPERYPNAKLYRIETNYRSTPEILSLANAIMACNVHQIPKQLAAARPAGIKPIVVSCNDAHEQAAFVAQRILELREEGTDLNNMAVLYRSHFHALELQMELTKRNIPFSITSGIRFFEQAHIKDVAAYIKLVANPRDELSFKRIVRMLPGIGGKSADKLWTAYNSHLSPSVHELSLNEPKILSAAPDGNSPLPLPKGEGRGEGGEPASESKTPAPQKFPLATTFQKCTAAVPKKTSISWAQLLATISQIEVEPVRNSASQMIGIVLEAGYKEYLQEHYANYRSRQEDLEQLAAFALQFATVEEFLTQLALQTSVESEANGPNQKDDEQIRLSTIHQAKGLEFDVVFLIMLCDGLFPSARSAESLEGEEEERRLFYVAATRARNELYLSYPILRLLQGGSGEVLQQPSRFLKELPKNLIEEWNLRPFNPYG